jgi:holo-[acyl-carrier protein] synthase
VTTEHSLTGGGPDTPIGGLGIDLESVERFNLVTKPGGRAFFERVYTPAEQRSAGGDPVLLALYYTAKEAVAKALGAGLDLSGAARVSGRDIEIHWTPGENRPTVALWRSAAARAESMHLSDVGVCWEHTPRVACSIAVGTDSRALLGSLAVALQEALAGFAVSGER